MSQGRVRGGFLSEMQRYPEDGWIAGVCAGIADYFGWKVQIVRLVTFLLLVFTAFWLVFIVYCILWHIMDPASMQDPNRPNYRTPPPDPMAPRGPSPAGAATTRPSANMSELKARFAKLEERLRNMEECVTSKDFDLRRELKRLET